MKYELMCMTYIVKDDRPIILLFARDENRERRTIAVKNFKPYFWAEGNETVDLFGRPISKVVCDLPSDVPRVRRQFAYHCEADVPFPLRFLIDKRIFCSFEVVDGDVQPCEPLNIPPKVLYFDIEVISPPGKLPKPEDPQFSIVSVQCSSNYHNELHLFTTSEKFNVDPIGQCTPVLHHFGNERQLLYGFAEFVEKEDPDVIAGYNSSNFDFPYLIRRALRLGVSLSRMSPIGVVELRKRRAKSADVKLRTEHEVYIPGREVIDLLELYQKVSGGKQGVQVDKPFGLSYDFKVVVAEECKFDYIDYGDSIEQVYNSRTFLEYIRNDAYALKLLDQTCGLIAHIDRLRRIVGAPLSYALSNKKLIDVWALRIRERPLPSGAERHEEPITGALVIEPPAGIHENVAVFDLKSLYPTLIINCNLSPETKSPDGTIVVSHWRYKRTPEGILPKIARTFLEEREKVREKLKTVSGAEYDRLKQVETLYKYLVCSIYGVEGYPGFRLYDPDVANSITWLGRSFIQSMQKFMEKNGYKVIYSDTDSVFVKLKTGSPGEIRLVEYLLSEAMRQFGKAYGIVRIPEVKFERLFKKILFKRRRLGKHRVQAVKKKYAGYTVDGKLYIIGFEPRRSDTAEATRETMKAFFQKLLVDGDLEGAIQIVRDAWKKLPTMPIQKVAIPKSLRKSNYEVDNPWVVGVQYSMKYFGKIFREDKRPRLVYVKHTVGLPSTHAICLTEDDEEVPKGIVVDWEKMRDVVLRKKFDGIFESLGLRFDDVIGVGKQTALERWF
jgi:DNA polymerase I